MGPNHNPILFLTITLRLLEWATAIGVVYGVARLWALKPDSSAVRFIRHPKRTWFALGLFFVPLVFGHLYQWWIITRAIHANGGIQFNVPAGVLLTVFYGLIWGLVGSLLSSLENGGRFRFWEAFWISTGLVLLFSIVQIFGWPLRQFQNIPLSDILAVLVFATFLTARAFPHKTLEAPADGTQPGHSNSPALALTLAFLPSAILLLTLPFLNANPPAGILILGCLVSVVCCFAASFMLFRRGTGLAVFGGIIFLLLNGFVSFLFGCGAVLTGMKF